MKSQKIWDDVVVLTVSDFGRTLTSNGAGMGVADANDTINVSATILNHASPSLVESATTLSQTIDFGSVNRNSGVHTLPATIFNLSSTAGLTAWLDVDQPSGTERHHILRAVE